METKQRYEIFLNHLSAAEFLVHRDTFEDYKKKVVPLLQCYDRYVFEDDLLGKLKEDLLLQSVRRGKPLTIEHVKTSFPDRYVQGGGKKRKKTDKEYIRAWYDVWDKDFCINPKHFQYELFFAYKIRNLDLLEIDRFLEYQLEKWHGNDSNKFARFLQLVLRIHGAKLIQPEYIQTINEWIEGQNKEIALSGIEKIKTKGKSRREADDYGTVLNQEQTALLIHLMQQSKIIRKDENLSNKEAGQAFSILTGFSADTLRQSLGKTDLEQIATKKNLNQLDSVLSSLATLIDNKILARK